MFSHPATQANLGASGRPRRRDRWPRRGPPGLGLGGPWSTFRADRRSWARSVTSCHAAAPWQGRRVLVTAGGTQEPIDPVRVLTNRSSGKQGLAVAQAALDAGAEVSLIATPVVARAPAGARHVLVGTRRRDGRRSPGGQRHGDDVLVMAAAVADFRPAHRSGSKDQKGRGHPHPALEPTVDILAAVASSGTTGFPRLVVGFAAETEDLLTTPAEETGSQKPWICWWPTT
jgi:phosphopantothenoylcysteine decarboxylase / phosphopantothenate---cysteine ligase